MAEKYSITQAVRDVCSEMDAGEKLLGYELYNKVLAKMHINGNRKHPLDSTVLRRVREVGSLYGVKAVRSGESIYIKERLF
jgi:hypothetical protein